MTTGSGIQENATVTRDILTAKFAELHRLARSGEAQTEQAEADMTSLEAEAIEHGYSIDEILAPLWLTEFYPQGTKGHACAPSEPLGKK